MTLEKSQQLYEKVLFQKPVKVVRFSEDLLKSNVCWRKCYRL